MVSLLVLLSFDIIANVLISRMDTAIVLSAEDVRRCSQIKIIFMYSYLCIHIVKIVLIFVRCHALVHDTFVDITG